MSKSREAPLNKMILPLLELMAAVETCRSSTLVPRHSTHNALVGRSDCAILVVIFEATEEIQVPTTSTEKHHVTTLIIRRAYEYIKHSDSPATKALVWQQYWVPAIRQVVNTVTRKCVICRSVCGPPYRAAEPPPLLKMRVDDSPPFSVTGIHFTGALYTRDSI